MAEGGYVVLCEGPEQALAVANAIAPEHLELLVADPEALLPLVRARRERERAGQQVAVELGLRTSEAA